MTRKTKSAPRAQARTGLDRARATVYTIDVEVDDTPVRGNASASGNNALDRETENEILERLARGDIWAWAYVKITAEHPSYPGYQGTACLGACSYRNEAEFRKDAYYADMCQEALTDLQRQVKENERGVMDTTVKVPKLENMARQQTIEDAAEISDIACSMFNDCRLSKVMKERLSAIQSRSARILRNNGGK